MDIKNAIVGGMFTPDLLRDLHTAYVSTMHNRIMTIIIDMFDSYYEYGYGEYNIYYGFTWKLREPTAQSIQNSDLIYNLNNAFIEACFKNSTGNIKRKSIHVDNLTDLYNKGCKTIETIVLLQKS